MKKTGVMLSKKAFGRVIALLSAFLIAVSGLPEEEIMTVKAAASGKCGNNLTWSYTPGKDARSGVLSIIMRGFK